jgi:hypothetical protein
MSLRKPGIQTFLNKIIMAKEGLAKGLAYKHDFGASINNLYRQEQMYAEQRVEKERKTKMYSEMLAKPPLASPGATKRLESFTEEVIADVSNYVMENPDFETDPKKFAEFKAKTDKIINNDIVRKDQQVQQSFQKLREDLMAGNIEEEDFEVEMEKYMKYQEDESGQEDYFYMRPKYIEMSDVIKKGVGIIGTERVTVQNADGGSSNVLRPNKGAVPDAVRTLLSDKWNKRAIEKSYKEERGEENGFTLEQFTANKIKNAIDIQDLKNSDGSSGDGYESTSQFYMNVRGPVTKAMKMGYTGKVTGAGVQNHVFTGWEIGKGDVIMPSSGIKFITQQEDDEGNVSTNYSEDFTGVSIKSLDNDQAGSLRSGIAAKMTGAGSIVTVSGNPYVESVVTIEFEEDESQESFFKEKGFKTVAGDKAPILINVRSKSNITTTTMSGKVLIPADFSRENQLKYDKESGVGQNAMDMLLSASEAHNYWEAENELNKLNERNMQGPLKDVDFKNKIDEITGQYDVKYEKDSSGKPKRNNDGSITFTTPDGSKFWMTRFGELMQ